jgi:hypothetical protein
MKNNGNCLSLTGKNVISINNLAGKNYGGGGDDVPNEIKEFKKSIMDNFMIPLITKRWGTIYDNLFRIEIYRSKLNNFLQSHPNSGLEFYKQILQLIYAIYSEHIELEDLEKKIFKIDDTGTFAYKTTRIRLKAEYELYNIILGKPIQGEQYDTFIIQKIIDLLKDETLSVDEIKKTILND